MLHIVEFWVVVAAAAVIVGVLLHELGHLVAALALGWKLDGMRRGIPALSFGVLLAPPAECDEEQLRHRFRIIAISGPLTNLVTGSVLWILFPDFGRLGTHHLFAVSSSTGLFWLAAIQVSLGIANLIPSKRNFKRNDGDMLFGYCRSSEKFRPLIEPDDNSPAAAQ